MTNPGAIFANLLNPGAEFAYRTRPVAASVTAVNTENNLMTVKTGASGNPKVGVPHPFLSPNAWIRAYPDTGATVLIHERAEEQAFVSLGYYRDTDSSQERNATEAVVPSGKTRKMSPGEIELMSIGMGNIYLDRRGNVELRSKLTRMVISNDNLEIKARAQTHVREIGGKVNPPGLAFVINNEERFGMTKRTLVTPAIESYISPVSVPPAIPPFSPVLGGGTPNFTKEYVRNISVKLAPGTPALVPVCDYREGSYVVTDQGIPDIVPIATVPPIPGPFRFRGRQFVVPNPPGTPAIPFTALDYGMDLLGNVGVTVPATGSFSLAAAAPGPPPAGLINMAAANGFTFLSGPGAGGFKVLSTGPLILASPIPPLVASFTSPPKPIAKVGDQVAILIDMIAPLIGAIPLVGGPCFPLTPGLAIPAGIILLSPP